jgi:carboxyvinyl-carboxyphosphonate phosphorylmutase
MRNTTRLRQLIEADEILVAPSAYDCLSARVIAQSGFQAVHMTGSGTSASLVGQPDLGLATASEMVTHALHIVQCTGLPVVVDADTGYGNALNVVRTIRELEGVGVAGVHLEDQVTPKRCGHLEGKSVISVEEMVGKIQAAAEARSDPDFVIIARTDAGAILGFDEAIRRSQAYVEAGASCVFVESLLSVEQMREAVRSIPVPLLANMVEGSKTPFLPVAELQEIGFGLAIYPLSGWMAAAAVMRELMRELRETGTTQNFWSKRGLEMSFQELFDVFGLQEARRMEERYLPSAGRTEEPART